METRTRDVRIDLLRGVGMVTIAIAHAQSFPRALGYSGSVVPTPTHFGFSSAAEVFVALSGYMVGLVYATRENYSEKLIRRAFKIYLLNLAAFVVLLPLIFVASQAILQDSQLIRWHQDPVTATLEFIAFLSAPKFLDVLPLYTLLMLIAVPSVWLLRKSALVLLLASITVYVTSQLWIGFGNVVQEHVAFWIPAWQLLFILPMIAGSFRLHVVAFSWTSRNLHMAIVPIGLLVAAAIYIRWGARFGLPEIVPPKHTLAPLRIVHAAVLIAGYAYVIVFTQRVVSTAPVRMLAMIGRQTLNCFLVSIVATYYGSVLIDEPLGGLPGYLATVAFVLLAVMLTAYLSEYWRVSNDSKTAFSASKT